MNIIRRSWSKGLRRNLSHLNDYTDKPTKYLEIGVFEGASMDLMLKNILTHPDSRAIGIDPWDKEYTLSRNVYPEKTAEDNWKNLLNNLIELKRNTKVDLIQGYSQHVLREQRWQDKHFDIIMIDGHHTGICVLRDFSLTWPLLKDGGIMIFDDYQREVKDAVDIILTFLGARNKRRNLRRESKYTLLFSNEQIGIRKIRD